MRNSLFIISRMYLAQARDQWRGVGLSDPTGNAGRNVGQQTELRLRYRWSKFLDTDTAYVYFAEGAFVRAVRPSAGIRQITSTYRPTYTSSGDICSLMISRSTASSPTLRRSILPRLITRRPTASAPIAQRTHCERSHG